MANYSLILDTKFKPFSYQELVAPIQSATQAHQALEEAYGDLATKANVAEMLANEAPDSLARSMYERYSKDLSDQADQLMRNGLSISSRKNMLDMKARYSKEITPIEVAYKRRGELAAEQRKAEQANPTIRYQRYAAHTSLDDFIKNPSLDYGKSYSGALLAQQVAAAASNYAKVLTDEGKLSSLGLPFQYRQRIRHGASPEEVLAVINDAALAGHEGAVSFLKGIRDQVMRSSGVADWADPTTYNEFLSYANLGLYNALGQTELKNYSDSYSMQDRLNARQRAAAASSGSGRDGFRMYNPNKTTYYGTSEIAAMNRATQAELDRWKKLGYFNAKGQLTRKGLRAFKEGSHPSKGSVYYSSRGAAPFQGINNNSKDFAEWVQKNVGTDSNGVRRVLDFNTYYQNTRRALARGELPTGTLNVDAFRVPIKGKENQDWVLQQITSNMGNAPIYEAGSLTQNKQGAISINRGKAYTRKDFLKLLSDKDNPVTLTYAVNVPSANKQVVQLSNGQKFILPEGTLSDDVMTNLNHIAISEQDIPGVNQSYMQAGSYQERAAIANMANSYVSSLLDYSSGADMKPSTGTINIDAR